jgi:tRNA(Ile)-lysidine synthase
VPSLATGTAPERPAARVAVAASGGRDSTALLHCVLRQARPLGVEVWALHVNHGLQAGADAWQARLSRQARRWGACFDARRLSGRPQSGESVEAWARRGRYAALAEMAGQAGCSLLLLAHHRRDQAETVLLQALRGGGAAALAAMPSLALRQGLVWARPWLALPAEVVAAYARRHRLRWEQDPSNDSPAYRRNRLRHRVWPTLLQDFPQAESTLVHTALRAADERELLSELALADLRALQSAGQGAASTDAGLPITRLQSLSAPRQRQVLRLWLRHCLPLPVPETLVRRLQAELQPGRAGQWPAPGGVLRSSRGQLHFRPEVPVVRPLSEP